ncbi:unnamed protein product [Thlaspi arvense]|uniref:CRC domain-containing protein n=1 Tax=Thlaspi arvense TaxID=13288 RepID=A0AAU9T7C9_THLAR|nr:unnamed protein product [Thlaspi arvense]
MQDSPVFNYINSLSPIRPVKSMPIPHHFSSLNFTSPPSVFTSPHLTSSHKESRFFKTHNSSSSDPTNHVEESTSNEHVAAEADDAKELNVDASIKTELPQINGSETNPDDPVPASPCGGDTVDLSLVPYASPRGENAGENAGGMELQKMYDDNVQGRNETPDWDSLIADASEMLIFSSPDDSEAFRCLMMQRSSNSEKRLMPHSNNEPESSNAVPCEAVSFLHRGSSSIIQETLDQTDHETREDVDQDVPVEPALEELHLSSPKKKRQVCLLKLEAGEGESCKRCNCKKSKCLKLYCECFAAGVYCIEPCSCIDCFNKPIHEDTVLATRKQIESRNPLAFAPKVIRSSDSILETGDDASKTPASARHKRGCNCKKSNCLKKYCECFQGGVGCSINCRCEGCKNAFGRKDGSSTVDIEAEQEEENEASEKSKTAKTQQNTEALIRREESSALPTTPMSIYRQQLVELHYSSSKNMMPPPQSLLGGGSSFSSQYLRKPETSSTQSRIEKSFGTVSENRGEDMPEILSHSSKDNLKAVSPNGKRVSPPHMDSSSPSILGRRSGGRKLILHSIPSFPSLTPQH